MDNKSSKALTTAQQAFPFTVLVLHVGHLVNVYSLGVLR